MQYTFVVEILRQMTDPVTLRWKWDGSHSTYSPQERKTITHEILSILNANPEICPPYRDLIGVSKNQAEPVDHAIEEFLISCPKKDTINLVVSLGQFLFGEDNLYSSGHVTPIAENLIAKGYKSEDFPMYFMSLEKNRRSFDSTFDEYLPH